MFNFNNVSNPDYEVHVNGELTARESVLAINKLLVDMDNYIILTSK